VRTCLQPVRERLLDVLLPKKKVEKEVDLNEHKQILDQWISYVINEEFEDAVALSSYPFKAQFLSDYGNPLNPEDTEVNTETVTDDQGIYRAIREGVDLVEITPLGIIRPSRYGVFPRSEMRLSMFVIDDDDAIGIVQGTDFDLHIFVRKEGDIVAIAGYAYEIALERLCRNDECLKRVRELME
jgi:hypothetical protein